MVQAATVTVLDSFGNDVAFAVASSTEGEQALRPRESTARPLTVVLYSKQASNV